MKKIINNYSISIFAYTLLLVQACQDKKEQETTKTNTEIINEVNTVIGVGKVVPKDGWAKISSPITARIYRILVEEGDSVQLDEPLFQLLDNNNVDSDLEEAKLRLSNLYAQRDVKAKDIAREKLKLQDLNQQYENSKKLYQSNAETLEKLNADLSAVQLQEKLIESMLTEQRIYGLNEQEQKISIEKAQKNKQDLIVKSPKAGIINEILVEIGQAISNTTELGRIVNSRDILIEAEVDELFANKVQLGQNVTLYAVGRTDSLGTGKIVYASPTLMNKSIRYESTGESEDRRVRKIKIQPQSNNNLLINAKVECQINIK